MSDKEKRIRELVRSYYTNNPKATEEMIKIACDKIIKKTTDSNLSVEELKKVLDDVYARKKKIEQIRQNHFKIVQHIEEVAESIGNVPTEAVENLLIAMESDLANYTSDQLIAYAIEQFKTYRNLDCEVDHKIPRILERVLNSDELKEILTDILSNQSTAGEHGIYLSANINRSNAVLSFVTNYIIVHQGDYALKELYEKLRSTDINSMSNSDLSDFFIKSIVESSRQRLGLEETSSPENKKKIAEYVFENFIRNGYCYQGTNSSFRDDINSQGLSSKFSRTTDEDLITVDKIFKKHGLDKIFYSKLSEAAVSPYYYTTESMNTAYFYSYHNPEYFAYFVASGNYMPDENYFRAAYYLRDRDSCRANLERLCKKYHLLLEEQQIVLSTFEKLSSKLINDGPNTVTLVSRRLLNKHNIPVNISDIQNKSIETIVREIMRSREISSGTKQHLPIPADKIHVISVPPLSRFYDTQRIDKDSVKKYIPLKDGSKYYYDILIHADAIDYDCISIKDCLPSLITLSSKDSDQKYAGKIDVISCSSDIGPDTLLSNGKPSFQSLQMMIAVNGKANSPEGEALIETSRNNYSPEYMSDYYYYLCELFCRVAAEKDLDITKRCQAIIRIAKDFFPKAELMRITGSYPEIVNEDRHLYEYLSYPERLQINEVELLKNGKEKTVDNDPIEYCINLFKEKLVGKLNPEFREEFNKKIDQYGIMSLIENSQHSNNSNQEIHPTEGPNEIIQSSSNELELMFENTHQHNSQSLSTDEPKSIEKTLTSPINKTTTSNDGGISNTIGLIMIIIATVIIILSLTILK